MSEHRMFRGASLVGSGPGDGGDLGDVPGWV